MSEWTENVNSVPENVRSYVSRCLFMAEWRHLYDGVDRLASSAICAGYNIEKVKHRMKAALDEAVSIVMEQDKERAA